MQNVKEGLLLVFSSLFVYGNRMNDTSGFTRIFKEVVCTIVISPDNENIIDVVSEVPLAIHNQSLLRSYALYKKTKIIHIPIEYVSDPYKVLGLISRQIQYTRVLLLVSIIKDLLTYREFCW